jgi:hypothetical protein
MSIQHGNLGIVRDGLVLYYDNTSKKSFRGEAAYNLLNDGAANCDSSAVPYFGGSVITSSNYDKGLKSFKVTTLGGGFLYLGTYYSTGVVVGTTSYRLSPPGTYSFSCKMWIPTGRRVIIGFRYYPQGEELIITVHGTNTWQSVSRSGLILTQASVLNIQAIGSADNGVTSTTTPDLIPEFTFYVAEPMINSGSYPIPYHASTYVSGISTVNVTAADYDTGLLPMTFTRTTGDGDWTSARITSSNAFSHSARVVFRPGTTDKFFMIALNTDPASGINWSNLDYAIYCKSDATYELRESGGGSIAPSGSTTYTTASIFEIKYDGSWITYWMNNQIVRSASRPVGNPFSLDSSFYSNGANVNNLLFTNGRSNTALGGGGLLDLSGISNVNTDVSFLSFDSTGSKSTITGSYSWFGSSSINLRDLTNDGNSHTYDIWFMPLGIPPGANDGYLFGRRGFHTAFYQSKANGTDIGGLLWYSDNTTAFLGTYPTTLNKWYHFVITVNEVTNVAAMYVNGIQHGASVPLTKALRTYTTDYFLYAGSPDDYATNCRISAVRLYNKALSPSEVLRNFNAHRHLYGY